MRTFPAAVVVYATLAISACCYARAESAADHEPNCTGDTVDRMGPDIAGRSRAFLNQLKVTVEEDNKKKLSRMVAYPVKVFVGNSQIRVRNRAEFLRGYEYFINANVRRAVKEQSSQCLFGNTQGFMVGNGEIWFSEIRGGLLKIISVNTNALSQ